MATYRVSDELGSIEARSEEEEQARFVELVHAWIAEYTREGEIESVNAALAEAYWFVR